MAQARQKALRARQARKTSSHGAGDGKAQNDKEDGDKEVSGVHSSGVLSVWRLPSASF